MNPSICIPKIDRTVTREFILSVFNRFSFGEIKRIDVINKNNDKRAFIHFKKWNTDDRSVRVRKILEAGDDFKIMYMEPWFWKCTVLHTKRR
jgi:predicted phosphatase